ncbi:MAG TPA: carboxymuconolactone decarboxylase family protein [Segeticoccus sp.]|uniref:carboxymuconolactone decarboxylase family protein n=1 Tax=Segeticoccus sp. TaxID=2706531 RepID=UPI002D7F537C|nr:carboxymuconolactone decarboxylase family protein [Segeticoccus sp.]HET8601998.1 carboxymuconolactone decarboxylase family protein [Segeticoccus sp.]
MARIPFTAPRTLSVRLGEHWSRRRFGTVIEPGRALAHQPQVMRTLAMAEMGVERWNRLDPTLKALATLVGASQIGCSWCMDFGYWESHHKGIDRRKLEDVPVWRDSDAYTELERLVMGYAEAMTATPPEVTDEQVAELREHLADDALVELTAMVSVENQRSRTNAALGLASQGFKASCTLTPVAGAQPAPAPVGRAG